MKKVIFSLIAIVLFSGFSYGQEQTLKNLSTEKQSEIMQSQMLTVVNTLSVFYTKGQTYEQFLKSIEISNPTKPVHGFLRRVYYYIKPVAKLQLFCISIF